MRRPSSVAPLPVVLILATLLALASPNTASADWPALGRPICSAAGSQVHAAITTDGADGAILAWQDHRAARVNLFAEHVLASGEPDAGWPADGRGLLVDPLVLEQETFGLASPVIVSDGAGGAIVVWEDNRSSTTDIDIFAQHVLASGVVDPAWPANGTALCAALGNQDLPATRTCLSWSPMGLAARSQRGVTRARAGATPTCSRSTCSPRGSWTQAGRATSTSSRNT